jgi:UDP-glucose 4-epimerase
MSKVLLTGGSGFIGTRLLQHPLFKEALTVGRTSPDKGGKFTYIPLTESSDYTEILSDVNVVVHVAARAHMMNEIARDPLSEYRKTNTLATLNLAKQAIKAGVKRFIFISSIKVLGDNTEIGQPFSITDSLNPKDAYGVSKAEAEIGLMRLCRDSNMAFVIIRPPLVYGAGVKGNFEKLLQLISMRIPLPLGSVNNKRSMVSIDNLVDLICVCIKDKKAKNQIFLVSDDFDMSLPELLYELSKARSYESRLIKFPLGLLRLMFFCLGKSGIYNRLCRSMQVDLTHTKRQLGWEPPFSIQQSLSEVWSQGEQ